MKSNMEKTVKVIKKERYHEGVGSRKTSTARARIFTKNPGVIVVNEKDYKKYFALPHHQSAVVSPIELLKIADKISATIRVRGGGLTGQAEAVRLAIAKALALFDPESRPKLRVAGFLTRDARMVERKKYGHKKARKSPQWNKR